MGELRTRIVTIHEAYEVTVGGGTRVHGAFSTEGEAVARYQELARRYPELVPGGSIGVRTRRAELLEPVQAELSPRGESSEKMRRAGRDYEDKRLYTVSETGRESR